MYQLLLQAKQILQIQGLRFYINKAKKAKVWSDPNADIKNTIKQYSSMFNVFVDIGANIGQITLDVANNFSKCISVEPSIENYNQLNENLQNRKISNVTTFNCALGKKKGIGKLFLSPYRIEQHRLKTAPNENWKTQNVEIRTLDDILEELDIHEKCVIKIDAEGSELPIFLGSPNTLQKDCVIISEIHPFLISINGFEPYDYVNFLESLGYSFFNLNGKPTSKKYLSRLCLKGKDKKYVFDNFLIKKCK